MNKTNISSGVCLLLLFITTYVRADGGDVLERMVQLPRSKGTIYALLGKVSEQSGCLFIYDSKVINNDSVVSTRRKRCTVRQAVNEITGRKDLHLKVLGNHVLITSQASVGKKVVLSTARPASLVLTGKLLDKDTGEPITQATVWVKGSSLGNITNGNGEFRLSLPDSLKNGVLSFSHLGYVGQNIRAAALEGRNNVLCLEPRIISLQEVVVRLVEPQKLIREMLQSRTRNYSSKPVYLTTFYREGVQLKNKFQSLTEAVFKVYKSSAMNTDAEDQVKVLKMSKIDNREETDSLITKIKSGVEACLQLDVVKNLPDFLQLDFDENRYTYTSGDIVTVDNRTANVVCFEQKHGVKEPLFRGELYIDSESNALLQSRFEVHPEHVAAATRLFVLRQGKNIKLSTRKVTYTVSYKPWKGTYYVHHIRGDIHFKMKKKRLFFANSNLHTWFEMVTCRIDDQGVTRFPRAERLPTHTILSDTQFQYDEAFWGDFNVIPLEEELSRIIEKVKLKIEKTD